MLISIPEISTAQLWESLSVMEREPQKIHGRRAKLQERLKRILK